MIADTINNKKLNPIVAEIFIRGSIGTIFFITESCFKIPKSKGVRLNTRHIFIIKIPSKR